MVDVTAKDFRAWADAVNATKPGYIDQNPAQWIKTLAEHIAVLAEMVERRDALVEAAPEEVTRDQS